MSCNKGVFRVAKQELADFARGEVSAITSVSYGTVDGMRSIECMGGSQPAGWKAADGRLWFPTIRGVVVIDPENLAINRLAPPVLIERVVYDATSIDPGRPATLPPGKGELEFHFTGLSLRNPEEVRFKYRLEGYDDNWIDSDTRRAAYYTNIPPGDYRFQVTASNEDGIWNETGAAFSFELRPHGSTPRCRAGCRETSPAYVRYWSIC